MFVGFESHLVNLEASSQGSREIVRRYSCCTVSPKLI